MGFGNGEIFDGQHPLNWGYDTPGDLGANVAGQVAGIIDNATGGFISAEDLNKATLLIPGPNYTGGQSTWKKLAWPGVSNPLK